MAFVYDHTLGTFAAQETGQENMVYETISHPVKSTVNGCYGAVLFGTASVVLLVVAAVQLHMLYNINQKIDDTQGKLILYLLHATNVHKIHARIL